MLKIPPKQEGLVIDSRDLEAVTAEELGELILVPAADLCVSDVVGVVFSLKRASAIAFALLFDVGMMFVVSRELITYLQ